MSDFEIRIDVESFPEFLATPEKKILHMRSLCWRHLASRSLNYHIHTHYTYHAYKYENIYSAKLQYYMLLSLQNAQDMALLCQGPII